MNKKRIITLVTILCMLFFLTGCSSDFSPISKETTFQNMMETGGIFGAILIYPIAQAINYFADSMGVFWSIVIVTVIINAILLAATFKSNVAMQRMQQIQPEQQKIQKKYEGRTDQASQMRMSQEMQQLYKKYDINPLSTILVTFIQFPILIAMYNAIRRSVAVSTGTFLGASLELTPKEGFAQFSWPLIGIYVAMILFQILSVSLPQILNKIRMKKEADIHHRHYEEPKNNNAMMTYGMVIFIGFIMLSWPCALSLYYVIVSIVNILKTLFIEKIMPKDNIVVKEQ